MILETELSLMLFSLQIEPMVVPNKMLQVHLRLLELQVLFYTYS